MLFQWLSQESRPRSIHSLPARRHSYLNIKLTEMLDKAGVPKHDNYTSSCTQQLDSQMKNGVFWDVTPCDSCKKQLIFEEWCLLGCYAVKTSNLTIDISSQHASVASYS
jgi:hypothetical protein